MNEFTTELFFNTTGEDEQNYFFGEPEIGIQTGVGEERSLQPGNYRIINGSLWRIISGLSTEKVRNRIQK